MTGDSNALVMPLNDRSPIILAPDEYDRWLTAPIEDVIALQFRKPFPAVRMAMERSDELWVPLSERGGRPRKQKDLRIVYPTLATRDRSFVRLRGRRRDEDGEHPHCASWVWRHFHMVITGQGQ
jgi:hypothetical protein